MNSPKVSIIIVAYNRCEELRATLNNVLQTRHEPLEVLVVDGASTDGTCEMLASYGETICWSSEPDRGIYDAMNKGLRRATGEYVWFINAGDRIHTPDVLVGAFDDDPDIIYGDTLVCDAARNPLGLRRKPLPETLTRRSFLRGMSVCHQSIVVRRTLAPDYDLRYRVAADIEWCLTAIERSTRIRNLHRILSEFETGGESSRRRHQALRERWRILCRHYGVVATFYGHLMIVFERLLSPRKFRK